jgi:hypothetical protein
VRTALSDQLRQDNFSNKKETNNNNDEIMQGIFFFHASQNKCSKPTGVNLVAIMLVIHSSLESVL